MKRLLHTAARWRRPIGAVAIITLIVTMSGALGKADQVPPGRVTAVGTDARVQLDDRQWITISGVVIPAVTDTSESCGAASARSAMQRLLIGKRVRVEPTVQGHGRLVLVETRQDVGMLLAREGWASPDTVSVESAPTADERAYTQRLVGPIDQARLDKAGWWGECAPHGAVN